MSLAICRDSQLEAVTEAFKAKCADAGLKITHQRLSIYLLLVESKDHPSAETIFSRLRGEMPTVSLDTVYRTCATFEEHGLIRRLKTVRSQARYEANLILHHHFICSSCGKVIDFEWPDFDRAVLPDNVLDLGSVTDRTAAISGTCGECSKKNADLLCQEATVSG